MQNYFVDWTIDIEASSPREAAEMARGHQTRRSTTATVFSVIDESGKKVQIDLLENKS